mgnify:CR=1 FL=1
MTLEDIKTAVREGKKVNWKTEAYEVSLYIFPDGEEQWLVMCGINNACWGLTHSDGITLSEKEEDYYLAE